MTETPPEDRNKLIDEEIRAYKEAEQPKRDSRFIVFVGAFVIVFGLLAAFLITTNQNTEQSVDNALEGLNPELAARLKPFQDRLDQNPNDSEAMVDIGFAYFEAGSFREAIRNFEKARETDSKNVDALVGIGMALQATGRREEAAPLYEEALQIEPDNSFAKIRKAYFLAEIDKNDEALKLLEEVEAVETDPDLITSITQGISDIKESAGQ